MVATVANPSHHFAFSFSDALLVCAVSEVAEWNSEGGPVSGRLVGIRTRFSAQKRLFADATVGRLLVEMHCVFDRCRHMTRAGGKLDADDTLTISREYRSVLRGAADVNDLTCTHMRDFTLWSLFETMFLKAGDTPICLDMMSWALDTFSFAQSAAEQAAEEIEQGLPREQGSFWRAVALQLVGLRFDACIDLLSSLKGDSVARLFVAHLEKLNVEWLADETKLHKFESWQETLKNMVTSHKFSDNRNILFLARSLTGDTIMLTRLAEAVLSEWWHLMPIFVLVRHPTAPYNALGPVAEECRAMFKNIDLDEEFDPFLAIFNLGDVSVLQHLLSNPWLSLHLVDVMFSTEAYTQPIHDMRAALLLQYGSSLIVNSSLWELGADYLLECGVEGKLRLETLIAAMHIEDEAMAEKLLRLCLEHDLEQSRACIINTMTYRHLRLQDWGQALNWALRGGRTKTLDTAVHRIMWNAEEKVIAGLCVLEHLDELLLLSPSLSFLHAFYRYQTTLRTGDIRAATQVLVPLIVSSGRPVTFNKILFQHLTTILIQYHQQAALTRDTIFELLNYFKQFTIDQATKEPEQEEEKSLRLIKRLLLTRLADVFVARG